MASNVNACRQLCAVFVIVSLYFDVACTTLWSGLFAVATYVPAADEKPSSIVATLPTGDRLYTTVAGHTVGPPGAANLLR